MKRGLDMFPRTDEMAKQWWIKSDGVSGDLTYLLSSRAIQNASV